MLDGFVIEGDVLEQAPLKAAKGKTHAIKRHYLTILVSVFVHLFLALLLFFTAEKYQPKQVEIINKAIKSYLYEMPAKPVVVKQAAEEVKVKDKEKLKIEIKPEALESNNITTNVTSTVSLSSKPKSEPKSKLSTKTKTKTKKPIQATFSAYKQLNSLRNSINEKIMADELSDLQQFRSPSVMHGEQVPVPHSTEQLTPEQKREKNTTKMSDDISITKYDNGICTIERKQFLGSPVEGSSAAFACGESKFDKSFREHMKKVRDKIIAVKKQTCT